MKIHMSPNHPLRPPNRRPERPRVFKYVPCSRCGRRARVPYETPPGTPALCYRCRQRVPNSTDLFKQGRW
jgi:predicted nucleic acid binding AN1-type Zn finger protein